MVRTVVVEVIVSVEVVLRWVDNCYVDVVIVVVWSWRHVPLVTCRIMVLVLVEFDVVCGGSANVDEGRGECDGLGGGHECIGCCISLGCCGVKMDGSCGLGRGGDRGAGN